MTRDLREIPDPLVDRLYRRSTAARWRVPLDTFANALRASASHRFGKEAASASQLQQYLESLHLDDLALACACAAGDEDAWDHFVREQRPGLYRAADAIDPMGGARESADAIYGELFSPGTGDDPRPSLFRYFHGRSSLATWLRAILAQRHVDRIRRNRRLDQLDDDAPAPAMVASAGEDPDRARLLPVLQMALRAAIAALSARDRLRVALYYVQSMTLASIGRTTGEHEATVSRQLARTRRAIRVDVERRLQNDYGLSPDEVRYCFECALDDAGPIDIAGALAPEACKKPGPERSI